MVTRLTDTFSQLQFYQKKDIFLFIIHKNYIVILHYMPCVINTVLLYILQFGPTLRVLSYVFHVAWSPAVVLEPADICGSGEMRLKIRMTVSILSSSVRWI